MFGGLTPNKLYFATRLATPSLAGPDPLRTGAYRLEIISAALQGSGTVHSTKKYQSQQFSLGVNKVTCTFMRPIN